MEGTLRGAERGARAGAPPDEGRRGAVLADRAAEIVACRRCKGRFVPKGADLIELGCGGGVRFFAHHARATGMDLSFQSLRRLDGAYHLARAVPG